MSRLNACALAISFALGASVAASVAVLLVWGKPRRRSDSLVTTSVRETPTAVGASHVDLSDFVVSEQLSRNILFFGKDGTEAIASSRILVVGLGGVGSHAAHLLLRAGVGYLKLVDFDQVCFWSLNRCFFAD